MIDLVDAASLAAELRAFLRSDCQTVIHSKKEVRQILEIIDAKIAATFRDLSYKEKQQINELVTVELIKTGVMKANTPIQPEITPASETCPEPFHWSAYDGVATEVEVIDFLYAFVRMIKPKIILETGTYLGHSAVSMALAQKKNGFGNLLSCDVDEEVLQRAVSLAMQNDIAMHVNFMLRQGMDVIRQLDDRSLDLVFIDSGDEQTRIDEINAVICKLSIKGFLLVHDLNKLHKVTSHLEYLKVKSILDGMAIMCTPRGIGVFQKI